jgi:hypothetical protein
VGLAGLIQGTFLPAILRWTHGVEVFADSLCYALALVWLLSERAPGRADGRQASSDSVDRLTVENQEAVMKTRGSGLVAVAARIVALTVVLIVVQAIGSRFLPAAQEAGQQPPQPSGSFLAIVIAVSLLQTIALAYPVIRSRWHGWRLIGTVFVLYFGTVTFMSQIESMVYLGAHMAPGMLRGIVLMGFFNALVFSPILVLALGKARVGPAEIDEPDRGLQMSWTAWTWKLAAGAGVFTSLYYLFGYYVAWKNPVLREYYGGTDPGSFLAQMAGIVRGTPWMLPLQFARGLLWVLLALPVMAMMKGRWWEAGLALSLLFGVPVVYLLFPNPVMPEAVRLTHLVETLPYQFLFGWFVAWLFARPAQQGLPAPHHQVTGA